MMKRLALGLLALATLAGLGLSGCHRHPPTAEERGQWMTKAVSYRLDLTPEQKGKLDEVRKAFVAAHKANEAERKKEFEGLKAQILGAKLDPAFAKDMIKKREAKIDENFDPIFAKIQDFHASLNDRQKKIAADELENWMTRE